MNRIGIIICVLAMIFGTGCTTTHTLNKPEIGAYNKKIHPAISVFVEYPNGWTSEYQRSVLASIPAALRNTGKFEAIGASKEWPTQVIVNYANVPEASNTNPLTWLKIIVSAGSLFLIPVQYTNTITCEFKIIQNGELKEVMKYQDTTSSYVSLFNAPKSKDEESLERIISNFANDLDERSLLDTNNTSHIKNNML